MRGQLGRADMQRDMTISTPLGGNLSPGSSLESEAQPTEYQ